jgi:hypothetical protein
VLAALGRVAIDLVQFIQRKVTLTVFGVRTSIMSPVCRLKRRTWFADVVVGAGGVAGVRLRKKPTIGQIFQHTISNDGSPVRLA